MITLNTLTQLLYQLTALLQIVQIATADLDDNATTIIWYIVGFTGPFYMIILLIVFSRICNGIVLETEASRPQPESLRVSLQLDDDREDSTFIQAHVSGMSHSTYDSAYSSDRVQIESLGCLILRSEQPVEKTN